MSTTPAFRSLWIGRNKRLLRTHVAKTIKPYKSRNRSQSTPKDHAPHVCSVIIQMSKSTKHCCCANADAPSTVVSGMLISITPCFQPTPPPPPREERPLPSSKTTVPVKKPPPSSGRPMPKSFVKSNAPPMIGANNPTPPASTLPTPTPTTPAHPQSAQPPVLPAPLEPVPARTISKHPPQKPAQEGSPPKQARHKHFPTGTSPPPRSPKDPPAELAPLVKPANHFLLLPNDLHLLGQAPTWAAPAEVVGPSWWETYSGRPPRDPQRNPQWSEKYFHDHVEWGTSKQHMKLQQPRNYDFRVRPTEVPKWQRPWFSTWPSLRGKSSLKTTLRVNSREMTTFAKSCNEREMQRPWNDKLETAQLRQNLRQISRRFVVVVVSSAFWKSLIEEYSPPRSVNRERNSPATWTARVGHASLRQTSKFRREAFMHCLHWQSPSIPLPTCYVQHWNRETKLGSARKENGERRHRKPDFTWYPKGVPHLQLNLKQIKTFASEGGCQKAQDVHKL